MDYRQYDNAIGRFNSIDRLSEITPSITPYRFALNNPNYFNDPSVLSEFENGNQGQALCPTCPNTPAFKPLIDDPNNIYVYDPETKTANKVIELDEVVVQGKPKSSSNTDYHNISMFFRSISGNAMTAQKPLGEAFTAGTRYASQLYSAHTSNVVYKTLGGKIQVPLGNYNTAAIGKLSKVLKITGRTLGVGAVALGVYDMSQNGINVSNGLDTTMAALALTPTGITQGIALAYFTTNFVLELTMDTNIGELIEKQVDEK
jgi:hypothetical protein